MIGTADLTKAIVQIWNDSDLNNKFQAFWQESKRDQFPVLNDEEAEGDHAFPYCIFNIPEPNTVTRSTAPDNRRKIREIRRGPLNFKIETKDPFAEKSAKEIAADLAAEIMRIYGGHPEQANALDGYSLDHGHILLCQYQTDFGVRSDLENWTWEIRYMVTTDVPVAV
jgi:hypothetical protein